MSEEINTGMSALESRFTNKMDKQYIQMKKDLEEETNAGAMLEERMVPLKSKDATKEKLTNPLR